MQTDIYSTNPAGNKNESQNILRVVFENKIEILDECAA